jgi:hypothetical protein
MKTSEIGTYTATLTYAYNSQPNATTGFSPFELVVPEAANMRTLKQELFDTMTGMSTAKSHYRETLMKPVHEVALVARENLQERQLRYKCSCAKYAEMRWGLCVCQRMLV